MNGRLNYRAYFRLEKNASKSKKMTDYFFLNNQSTSVIIEHNEAYPTPLYPNS